MTLDESVEYIMVAGMEGVGVETFEMAGGLAELRMTIVVKWGVEHSVRKVLNFWVFAPP